MCPPMLAAYFHTLSPFIVRFSDDVGIRWYGVSYIAGFLVAYLEIHSDERGTTCAGFLERAIAFYADLGVRVERVITDNAFAYRKSAAFRKVFADYRVTQKFIRPHCPWTNGGLCQAS